MKTKPTLHPNATEHIRIHYPEAVIEKTRRRTDQHGKVEYEVTVDHDEVITHLLFNSEGHVVHQSDDPIFPEDYFEGDFYADEP